MHFLSQIYIIDENCQYSSLLQLRRQTEVNTNLVKAEGSLDFNFEPSTATQEIIMTNISAYIVNLEGETPFPSKTEPPTSKSLFFCLSFIQLSKINSWRSWRYLTRAHSNIDHWWCGGLLGKSKRAN